MKQKTRKSYLKECLGLYWAFFKIGLVTFGGGYAMLPFIQREICENKKWATETEILDCYAIGQMTPGVIAVNTATFIGYKLQGVGGAIFSTLGVITPSLFIITILAAAFSTFIDNPIVRKALLGVNVVVAMLLVSATIKMGKKAITDKFGLVIAFTCFMLVMFTDITAVYFVIASGALTVIVRQIIRKNKKGEDSGIS